LAGGAVDKDDGADDAMGNAASKKRRSGGGGRGRGRGANGTSLLAAAPQPLTRTLSGDSTAPGAFFDALEDFDDDGGSVAADPHHHHHKLGSAACAAEASGLSPSVVAALEAYQSGAASTCKTVGALLAALHAARAAPTGTTVAGGGGGLGAGPDGSFLPPRAPTPAALDAEAEAVLLAEMEQAEYEQRQQQQGLGGGGGYTNNATDNTGNALAEARAKAMAAAAAAAVPAGDTERAQELAGAIAALPPIYPTAAAATEAQRRAAELAAGGRISSSQPGQQAQQQQQQPQQQRQIAPILRWVRLLRSVLRDWRDFSAENRWRVVSTGALQMWYKPPAGLPPGHPRGQPPPRGSNVHTFKGACVLEEPLERIVALAAECDLVTQWNTAFSEFTALGWLSAHETVVRTSLWTPWPLTPPEMVMHAAGFDLLDSPEGCVIIAIEQPSTALLAALGAARRGKGHPPPPGPPPPKRDRMRTCPSCYRFEPLPPHPVTGAPRTHATVMMQLDAGHVMVPEVVLRFVLTMMAPTVHRLVLKTLRRLFGGGAAGGGVTGAGVAASAASVSAPFAASAGGGEAAAAATLVSRIAARPELYDAIRRRAERRVRGMVLGTVPLGEAGAALASGQGFGGAPGGGMLTPAELEHARAVSAASLAGGGHGSASGGGGGGMLAALQRTLSGGGGGGGGGSGAHHAHPAAAEAVA
jgi:hypothetical protein